MSGAALERVFREAGGRITAALASRFRSLDLAEDSLAEAYLRATTDWADGVPDDPAAWLYQVAYRYAIDVRRRQQREWRFASLELPATSDGGPPDDSALIPDERLKLIFICCHPAVAVEARAALTLRLVCGLSTLEIARAFLVPEATLAQRLVRAKRKIADAGVPFEVPGPAVWRERLDSVLSTLEVAYSKAHEDASGSGPHANYALEVLELTRVLAQLLPLDAEVLALASMTRYAEARRPARTDSRGQMTPLSEQDPLLWNRQLIAEADEYLIRANSLNGDGFRVLQAALHGIWCARRSLADIPPWREVLGLYDALLRHRDDAIVRLNRSVAVAEVFGADVALAEIEALDVSEMQQFQPYHAVRADFLRNLGRTEEARCAYNVAIGLGASPAERLFLLRNRAKLGAH